MNSTVTARVETEYPLTINESNIVRAASAYINNIGHKPTGTLDFIERFLDGLKLALNAESEGAPWLVYRGGSHVALIKGTERIVLVTERRPEPEPVKPGWNDWKALPAYIQSVKDKAEALQACTGAVSVTVTDGDQTATVAVSEAAQAMIDGTYDQKAGGETAAREAAEARNRVMGYLAAFTDREGRAYASAYAHWCDEVGEEGAVAYAANRGQGLTGSRKATIRRAIIAARAGA